MFADFDHRVTLGLVQWITLIDVDDAAGIVRIGLTHHPENSATECSIGFTSVTKLASDWFDRDDECMESIIGAHEQREGELLRYMFHTEQRELYIWTSDVATISRPQN